MHFKKVSFLKAFPFLLALAVLSPLKFIFWFSTTNYPGFVGYIINTLNRPDLYNLFTSTLFTKERYDLVYKIHWLAYPIIVLLAVVVIINRKAITFGTERLLYHSAYFFKLFKEYLSQLPKLDKWTLIAIISFYFLLSYYKVLNRNITYDEAWNYNYFISKPPYFSLILFNTYPLYHFIASSIHFIPIDPCLLSRTLSILIGSLFLLLILCINGKLYGHTVAVIMSFILMSSPFFVVYSAIMKGTLLACIFVLVHFYATIGLVKSKGGIKYLIPYLFSSFLQVAAMPTTLFCSLGSGIGLSLYFLSLKKLKPLFQVLCFGSFAVLCSLLFYLPIIITGGKEKLLEKQDNSGGLLEMLKTFFCDVSILLWGSGYLCPILFMVGITTVLLFKRKDDVALPLVVGLLSITTILIFSFSHPLPDRSLSFIITPYLAITAPIFSILFKNKYTFLNPLLKAAFVLSFLLLSLFPIWAYTYEYVHPIGIDKSLSKRISTFMLKNNVKSCYVFNTDFWINYPEIEYYYSLKQKKWEMYNNQQNSTRYRTFNSQNGYDCIVTSDTMATSSINGYKVGWEEKNIKLLLKERPSIR